MKSGCVYPADVSGEVMQDGTPISNIPSEIINYYLEHDYGKKGIPLSAKTINDIAEILGVNG